MAALFTPAIACTTQLPSSPVAQYGDLTFVGETATGGNYPRSFAFDPTGQFLACCNQRGDNVTTFRVDPKTGRLTSTGHFTPVGNPSSIVFVDLAKTIENPTGGQ